MLDSSINNLPQQGSPVKSAFIMLHGYGADGQDLISMVPLLREYLPNTAFYAPNAPVKEQMGYKWFDIDEMAADTVYERFFYIQTLMERALPVLPMINDFIDKIKSLHGLKDEQIALMGFSQGGLLSLMTGLTRAGRLNSLVSCSGIPLAINTALPMEKIINKPDTLLTHGEDDDVVPFVGMQMTRSTLANLDFHVTTHTVPGMGHSIDMGCLHTMGAFLKSHLGQ